MNLLICFSWFLHSQCAFQDMKAGRYGFISGSPEYIAEDPRFEELLETTSFANLVDYMIFDEAHCISQWSTFRDAYLKLCKLRFLLPKATVYATSATLPPDVMADVKRELGLKSDDTETLIRSNDRHNLRYVVRAIRFTQQSLFDLAFLVPLGLHAGSPLPPSFMVFASTKALCESIAESLRSRLPDEMKDKIVWIHADMSKEHNNRQLARLASGDLIGGVATDSAGLVSPQNFRPIGWI